jgi:hypothetical protein
MLIDSEELKKRLLAIDVVYESMGASGLPSYSIFKSLIEVVERETVEKEGD